MTALALAFAMSVGLTQGAFAAEPEESIEEQIQAEIQARTEEVYNLVYEQLEAQNAVDMIDSYMDIFIPEIELEIMLKYNEGIVPYFNRYCNFTYGGAVSYTKASTGEGVVDTYLDRDHTLHYILNEESFTVKTILESIVGFVPFLGNFASIVCAIQTISSAINKQSINNAEGYARVLNIYNPNTDGKSSVCIGWTTYPYSLTYDTDECLNFTREFFEESDPWEGEEE